MFCSGKGLRRRKLCSAPIGRCTLRLNAIEAMMLNNPARRIVQRYYETPLLLRMAHRLDGKRVLEIGCGQEESLDRSRPQFHSPK